MRKTSISLAAVLLSCLILLMTGCGGTPVTQQPAGTGGVPGTASDIDPIVKTSIAYEEKVAEFDTVYKYGDDPYESYLFWFDCEAADIYFVRLALDAENWTTDGVPVFELDSLKPGEAIYYNMMVPEGMPAEAIIYDAGGKTYMFAIGYNGRDGGISLVEIDTLIVDKQLYENSFSEDTTTTTATTTTAASTETAAEIYWVNVDTLEIFAKETTVESDSKWHIWKALKAENASLIPADCSLLSGELVPGSNGVMELDFSASFSEISLKGCEALILRAIANTYISAYDLTAVRFKVEGEPYSSENCEAGYEFAYTE